MKHRYEKEFKAIIIRKVKIEYPNEEKDMIKKIVNQYLESFLKFTENLKGHYTFNEYEIMLNEIF